MAKKLWRPPPKREYKPRDPEVTSAMMAAVRHRENKAEVALRRELWRRGLRYRLYSDKLVGKPDLVFVSARAVVFVDGDFWHGRAIRENGVSAFRATLRTDKRDWWVDKLSRNAERDQRVNAELRRSGWRVLRLWESDVKANLSRVADKVERFVLASSSRRSASK